MNHWIATNTTGSYCLKIVKRVVDRIIFCTRNVCLQHKHKHVDAGTTSPTARSMNSVIQTVHSFLMRYHSLLWDLVLCWRRTFRACYVKTMQLTTRLTIIETNTASHACCYSVIHQNVKYCVGGSICHLTFSKAMLAHNLCEVCTFCIVLLSVSSRTCLPICVEIGLYLTVMEKEIRWHVFLGGTQYILMLNSLRVLCMLQLYVDAVDVLAGVDSSNINSFQPRYWLVWLMTFWRVLKF